MPFPPSARLLRDATTPSVPAGRSVRTGIPVLRRVTRGTAGRSNVPRPFPEGTRDDLPLCTECTGPRVDWQPFRSRQSIGTGRRERGVRGRGRRGRRAAGACWRATVGVPGSSCGSVHGLCTRSGGWAVGLVSAADEQRASAVTRRGFDLDAWIRSLCALVVGGVAAYASYVHQREFARQGGADAVGSADAPGTGCRMGSVSAGDRRLFGRERRGGAGVGVEAGAPRWPRLPRGTDDGRHPFPTSG